MHNHEEVMLLPQKSRISQSSQVSNTYIIKVWEDIGEPSEWTDELDTINSATEIDTIVLDICSGGGVLDTAMLFNRALRNTPAHTVAIIGPSAASAASVFALSCREFILDETSSLMIHTSTYGIMAKDTDIFEHANFSRKQLKTLYESVYRGFLSEEEMQDVIKGTPFYFDATQLESRLDSLTEYRNSQVCDCEECQAKEESEQDFEELPTLDEMISSAVASGIEQYEKKRLAAEKKDATAVKKKSVKIIEEKE
jgi:ATP-dependent protease ClpP protease subunit